MEGKPVRLHGVVVDFDSGAGLVCIALGGFAAGLAGERRGAEQGAEGTGDDQRTQQLAASSGDAAGRSEAGGGLHEAEVLAGCQNEVGKGLFLPMGISLHRSLLLQNQ
jgi:hypothetical protein